MPSNAEAPNSARSDPGEATAPGPGAVAAPDQEAVPAIDPEAVYPADLDQFIPCDERDGGCDDEESEEFDGDAIVGLSAEPSLLEWAFDQYYTTKTFLLALTDKLETPEYRLIRTEQVRNICLGVLSLYGLGCVILLLFLTEPKCQGGLFTGDHKKVIAGNRIYFKKLAAGLVAQSLPYLPICYSSKARDRMENGDAQMVSNDLTRQDTSKDMHIDLFGS